MTSKNGLLRTKDVATIPPVMQLVPGDCRLGLATLDPNSVGACVTDPPYEIKFMSKGWDDSGVAYDPATWEAVLRVLKPGGYLLAFGASRTFHRMAVAIEDAGFEIRDCLMWMYSSGFPHGMDVSKAIDKTLGVERTELVRNVGGKTNTGISLGKFNEDKVIPMYGPASDEAKQWDGWNTNLKPALEPIVMARKPLEGTVAKNTLKHGVGGINVEGSRIPLPDDEGTRPDVARQAKKVDRYVFGDKNGGVGLGTGIVVGATDKGRFPSNVLLDEAAAAHLDDNTEDWVKGGASRYFYVAKAPKKERPIALDGTRHPTVKPLSLIRYLLTLVTPPGETVLDPFLGSGTLAEAAMLEGYSWAGCEANPDYMGLIQFRMARAVIEITGMDPADACARVGLPGVPEMLGEIGRAHV